jgi:hypothetical protein
LRFLKWNKRNVILVRKSLLTIPAQLRSSVQDVVSSRLLGVIIVEKTLLSTHALLADLKDQTNFRGENNGESNNYI